MAAKVLHKNIYQGWDLYENGKFRQRFYSKKKAINIAQIIGQNLFGIKHCEIVDSLTGEIVYNIN